MIASGEQGMNKVQKEGLVRNPGPVSSRVVISDSVKGIEAIRTEEKGKGRGRLRVYPFESKYHMAVISPAYWR